MEKLIINDGKKLYYEEIKKLFSGRCLKLYIIKQMIKNNGTISYNEILDNLPIGWKNIHRSYLSQTLKELRDMGMNYYKSGSEVFISMDSDQERFFNRFFNSIDIYLQDMVNSPKRNQIATSTWLDNNIFQIVKDEVIE